MKLKTLITGVAVSATLIAGAAIAQRVTNQYLSTTYNELRNWAGQYATPSVYLDRNVCGEPRGVTAYACGQNIQLGTQFLQGLENRYSYAAKGVFAHEWGHSIQFKYGIYSNPPYQELQADCVSGAYAYRAENNLGYRGLFNAVQSTAYNSGDPTHGTGSQRAYYVRNGYNTNGNLVGCF